MRALVGLAVVIIAVAAWSESACGATISQIRQRGYAIVATQDDAPPFEYHARSGFVGFDNDLLQILRKSAGFEIRQEVHSLQDVLAGTVEGRYDIGLTALAISPMRAKSLDFTVPIAKTTMAYVFLKAGGPGRSVEDLSGKTIAVQAQGPSAEVLANLASRLRETGGKIGRVVQYHTYAEAYEDLIRRRVDAVINDRDVLSQLVGRTSGLLELGETIGPTFDVAWAVKKRNSGLLRVLNEFIEQKSIDGTLRRLEVKYGLVGNGNHRP